MKHICFLLLLLGVTLTSCSSDEEQAQNLDGRKLRQLTISEVPVTRATLTDNESVLGAAWKEGDQATYFNVSTFGGDNIDSGTLRASASASTSAFTGTVRCKAGDNVALFYPYQDVPIQDPGRGTFTVSLAGQDGTLATIAERFHYVYGVAAVTSVTDNTAKATIDNMQSLLAVCKFTFTDGTNAIPVKTLTINYYDNSMSYTTIGYPLSATLTPTADVSTLALTYPNQGNDAWNDKGLSVTLDSETSDGVYVALFPHSPTGYMHFTVTNSSDTYTGTAKAKLKAGKYYPVSLKLTKQ